MKKILISLLIFFSLADISTVKAQSNLNDTVNSLNSFAFDLYGKVSDPNESAIFSPYSLSSLLGILVNGSAGKTHDQLMNVLHLSASKNASAAAMDLTNVNTTLTASALCAKPENCQGNAFVIGNALWADENLTYKKTFLDTMQKNPSINFFRVDFAHTPDQAKDKINAWVDTKTKGYIKNLIASIPSTTKLVLTNAIYFKGLWQLPFETKDTQQHAFVSGNGSKTQVPMMSQQDKFLYAENDMLQMIQLNYTQTSLAMAILLPKPKHNLRQMQQAMNAALFSQLILSSYHTEVHVSIPKFKLDSTFNSLKSSLQALGLTDAFGDNANFSNITTDKLFISEVIQKAVIQVDEKGTVAAAATGIMMATAIASPPPRPVYFTADHPFVFIIFDKQSGLIVFMGQVTNPR